MIHGAYRLPVRWRTFLLLLLCCAAAPSTLAQAPQSARPTTGPTVSPTAARGYQLQPGDILEILVWKEEDLTKEVLIRPDGGISFPLAGDLQASGRTVEELRTELTTRLGRFIPDLDVTVLLKEVKGNKIYVIGQVTKPGEFIVNPQVDVMQALTMAGGTTAFAALGDIFVLRRNGEEQTRLRFDFTAVSKGRDLQQNVMLQSGDVVVVP
jgi:polysaccharide export outer membrane protein